MDCCQTWPDISSVTIKDVQDKAEKNFFKVSLVGTLNLCIKAPEKKKKTRNQSDHPRQRKCSKSGKNRTNSDFAIFWQFWGVFSA